MNIELAKWSKLQPPARVIFRKSPSAVDYLSLSFCSSLRFPFLVSSHLSVLLFFPLPSRLSSSCRRDLTALFLPLALAVNQANLVPYDPAK